MPVGVALAHVALRPSFDCGKCGEPWPCAPAKVELAEQFQADLLGLSTYLGAQMVDAMEQATGNCAWGRVDNLFDRFLGWIPRDRRDRRAA
ncbi:hypothetical protein Ari01nite_15340 [Paractinoplanes rishiriensis]|uniref:Flavin reductase n=1 Tax=Paractinoplanes rishiriensis TaxID=1050105 RepID=A0A919JVL0_9ACTN|nr:hypothetical protein Ari01nite_15340 [Actinoplanes rishiriensis]